MYPFLQTTCVYQIYVSVISNFLLLLTFCMSCFNNICCIPAYKLYMYTSIIFHILCPQFYLLYVYILFYYIYSFLPTPFLHISLLWSLGLFLFWSLCWEALIYWRKNIFEKFKQNYFDRKIYLIKIIEHIFCVNIGFNMTNLTCFTNRFLISK